MGAKIVIVDAEPIVRDIIASILERDGYEVTQTDDPEIVIKILRADPPALIITNVALPGISGHDAMLLFKQCSPDTPVLMVPGLPDTDVITEWKHRDGFQIFPKPFTAGALRVKVREMLSLRADKAHYPG